MKKNVLILIGFILFWIGGAYGQEVIKGEVYDENNLPLPGVNVTEEDTNNGTVTNFDGKFELEVTDLQSNLKFSFTGYETVNLSASEAKGRVELSPDRTTLSEVIIVGYGESSKKDLTGSISAVKMDDAMKQPSSNIGDAIQGRVSGVHTITSGKPGENPTFRIRGTGTIGNNNPLIVVDGMPLNGGLNQVNMNDIASMQVLKDASATAIYGSRGANGVIIISTKQGEGSKKGKISVEAFKSFQKATNIPKVLNATQFAKFHNEMLTNAGEDINPDFKNPNELGVGTDWLDAFFDMGSQEEVSLSYSKGGDNTKLYTSFNVFNQKGVVTGVNYERYNFQLNTVTDINGVFKFGNNLKLNYDRKNQGEYNVRDALLSLPTQPIFRSDGQYSGPRGNGMYSGDIENPIGKANIIDQKTDGYNLHGSVFGEVNILKNLKFKSSLGAELNFWDDRTWAPAYEWDSHVAKNEFLSQSSNKSITMTFDNTLTYTKTIKNGPKLTAMVGTDATENNFKFINGSIENFPSDKTQQLDNGIDKKNIGGSTSSWSLFSYFARVNANYKDKYYITGTVRRDGSSRFGSGNKYGVFPSISGAWRISEESFLRENNLIEDLKLRAGYGVTGNQEIGNYPFASEYKTFVYNFNDHYVTAAVPRVLPNPDVHWESQKQYNLGIDAVLFSGKIELTLDAYTKDTKDMLVPQSVPITTGYSDSEVPDINAGAMQNKGIEISLASENIKTEWFSWDSHFVFSYNKNKVVNINSDVPLTTGQIGLNQSLARIQAGLPINSFYGYVTDGIFQSQKEVDESALQSNGSDPSSSTAPGDIKFKDLNNDGVINDKDRTIIGNPNPKFTFSLNNNFSYKNWNLSVYLQGVYGNDIFNANRIYMENMSVTTNQSTEVLNRWGGGNSSGTLPRAIYGDPNNNNRVSDRFVEDGSYLRVKSVNLSYTIPQDLFGMSFLSGGRIYVSGENLITISNYSGFDPEVNVTGIDNNNFPVLRTISLGFQLDF